MDESLQVNPQESQLYDELESCRARIAALESALREREALLTMGNGIMVERAYFDALRVRAESAEATLVEIDLEVAWIKGVNQDDALVKRIHDIGEQRDTAEAALREREAE